MSWNILSDAWWQQGKPIGEYDHTPEEHGEWLFRLKLLLQWIEVFHPDVLALQEVDYDKFGEDLLPELSKHGYDGRMQNPKKKAAKQPCGVATFWKKDKYTLEKEVSFSRTQCVVLNCSETETQTIPQQLCIINVHLESSQTEVGCDRRARQLNSALAYAATEARSAALLICGDCNTGADASLFRAIRDYQWHGHSLSSVYEHPDTHATLPVSGATFMVPHHHFVIDHMLYEQDTLKLKCALNASSQEEVDDHVQGLESGFPSAFCPSDHIPVRAMFEVLSYSRQSEPETVTTVSEERKAELTAE